ncbi:MAG: type II toxin-antitoxin system HicB family antitoxin [bacterium]|nr:type II toxin-antitoxin system HicB family antitoxin [bacterium]
MTKQTFLVELNKGEEFYCARVVNHSNCFTQGYTVEETIENIREVISLMIDIRIIEKSKVLMAA